MTAPIPLPDGPCVVDLDGVVWLSGVPIPGAADAIASLRGSGRPVLFATNNARSTRREHLERLAAAGIPAAEHDLLTSADAAAGLLEPGMSAVVCGGPGTVEALRLRGVRVVEGPEADAVVVSLTDEFDYARLTAAARALHAGARLIGTNDDATFPTPAGMIPGAGALLAAVATAGRAQPVVAGKPHAPMAELVRRRVGPAGVVVGDRPSTDGLLAREIGAPFALVLSGVTSRDEVAALHPAPAFVAADLAALVAGRLIPAADPSGEARAHRGGPGPVVP